MGTTTSERETIDIETSGGGAEVKIMGRTIIELVIKGDSAADYKIQGREDGGTWEDTGVTKTGSAEYRDTLETGWHDIRVECTAGTGVANESAEIIMCASGS